MPQHVAQDANLSSGEYMSIQLGIVDFDSSHSVEFTKRLNHVGITEDQWVNGAQVTIGCPGTSIVSPERVSGFAEEMTQYGVQLVEDPERMIGTVDAVMILSVDGSVHWERARPFIEAGIACYIDKPFTCCLDEARRLVNLASLKQVPMFSSSALRYAPELVHFVTQVSESRSNVGALWGASVYGPSPVAVRNPGLFHYGIHPTEMLFTLMGPDCERLTCVSTDGTVESNETGVEAITGCWLDGRLASLRGIRTGTRAYGFTAFCEDEIRHVSISTEYLYRELLKKIVDFFRTGDSPVTLAETLQLALS